MTGLWSIIERMGLQCQPPLIMYKPYVLKSRDFSTVVKLQTQQNTPNLVHFL